MTGEPVRLVDVHEVAGAARTVVARFERDFAAELAHVEVHHIGATSLPFGHTKGDVDVNVRAGADAFAPLVAALRARLEEAQRENWTPSFASFSTGAYELPLGIQVTVIGSPDDFLLALRDRMRADAALLQRYDECKLAAAAAGADAYWAAKNELLQGLLRG
ncbi:MAG TPA: GrpB family protein [Gaiellaceae bacterium]|nr:GrpB family protein [Gaiellaceae bacterium]